MADVAGAVAPTLAENLDSVFLTCRAFLRHVETTKTGSLVLVSSTAGLFGEAGHSDYAAAKGALASGFVKSLKNELGRIAPMARVNVVCPGWTEVGRNRAKLQDPAFLSRVTRTMALRKVGRPEDVARVIVTLASDRISGHVTGEVITVAGGMEGRVLHDELSWMCAHTTARRGTGRWPRGIGGRCPWRPRSSPPPARASGAWC